MSTPTSTYRLQIRESLTLDDAAGLVRYLHELGVGAVYCSPLLQAAAGSDHGYDVVDVRHVDPARGGPAGLQRLVTSAHDSGLGVVVDIVPNHVGVAEASENPFWWDLLRHGRESAYAGWFDVDWESGPLLLPVLGDGIDTAADLDSELTVDGDELHYYERRFPLAPGTSDGTPSEVMERQHYRLVNFRRADTEQNYRRFFAVTTLAGLRVEDPDVFAETHREVVRWVDELGIDGIRIDHPDGLVDPTTYLERLRSAAGDAWIVVEKILEPGERLPDWPVAGTTGYDAMAAVDAVLVDPAAEAPLTTTYRSLTGDERDFHAHVLEGKRLVATTILSAEVRRLARLVPDVPDAHDALLELVVRFPVYRAYLPAGAEYVDQAFAAAREARPDLTAAFDALDPVLRDPSLEVARRFPQVTGAVTAKGVEDTTYYRYSRVLMANEVGGDPSRVGLSLDGFHAAQAIRQDELPESMTSLSTHDTKRGEDVRARLAVLAELRDDWAELATALMRLAPVPNPSFGYLLWQTFVGVGLAERERLHAYAEKAMREAADGTGWIDPVAAFEDAVHTAVDAAYDDPAVREPLTAFLARVEAPGRVNALTHKLVQLTMPGVPDVYQGTELWEDSLVDPDNRRRVDFATRRTMLAGLGTPPVDATGAAKLLVTASALRARRDRPELFGGYSPVRAEGPAADHALAFDRGGALTVATRLPVGLDREGGWRDTTLDLPTAATDALTGRSYAAGPVALADLLETYPVALLLKDSTS